ncbi:hypothetical protein [Pseudomonas sp. RIT-PI-S]|uniref:hypothetical protein n=1 Tax=Pseudomonas sp. RIT-PI-S TaxID=3035295 RepID=UPI0021DA3D5E|nr:hypothetical protein [Pseudomonas sp. RIT-PI-S]
MNTYDAKHLQLLDLIEASRWQEISEEDLHELKVLVVCKYVAFTKGRDDQLMVALNPEGKHYHQRLSELVSR